MSLSLKERLLKAKNRLKNVETKVLHADGREFTQRRSSTGDVEITNVSVRPWGFVGDFKPDLQLAEVHPRLYVGSQDPASEPDLLRQHNITHIINAATLVPDYYPDQFTYLHLDVTDLPSTNLKQHFERCNTFIANALATPNHAVFVHCNAGVSRSTTICIAFIMKQTGTDLVDAFNQVKAVRKHAAPNLGFWQQLRDYDKELNPVNVIIDEAQVKKL